MITLYTYDNRNIYSGALQIDPLREVVPGLLIAPPATTGTQVAQAKGNAWVILPSYPNPLPPVVPQQVTRRQARQALHLAGFLDSVPAAIAAIPNITQRKLAEIEWEDSLNFERNRPLLISLAYALGMNSDSLDALFIQAATL